MRILKSILDCCHTTITCCVNGMHHSSFRKEVVVVIGAVFAPPFKPIAKVYSLNSCRHIISVFYYTKLNRKSVCCSNKCEDEPSSSAGPNKQKIDSFILERLSLILLPILPENLVDIVLVRSDGGYKTSLNISLSGLT